MTVTVATKALNKRRKRWVPNASALCPICGVLLREHPHCRACTILVGPGHVETGLVDGLCSSCHRANRHRKRRLV